MKRAYVIAEVTKDGTVRVLEDFDESFDTLQEAEKFLDNWNPNTFMYGYRSFAVVSIWKQK